MLLDNLNQIPVSRSKTGNEKTFSSRGTHSLTRLAKMTGCATCSPTSFAGQRQQEDDDQTCARRHRPVVSFAARSEGLVLPSSCDRVNQRLAVSTDKATKYPYRLRLSNLQASVRRESDARLYQTQHLKEIAACPRPMFRSFDYLKWRGTKVF